MDKIKTLHFLKNTYCRIKPSKIGGVGIFAIRDIPKNTNIFLGQNEQKWYRFKIEELNNLPQGVMNMIDDFFVIEKDKTVLIPERGLNSIDISFFLNHSKKPNTKTIDEGNTFFSLREIKKGEEITVSYISYDYKWKNL